MSQQITLDQWLQILEGVAPDAYKALREDTGLMDNVEAAFPHYQQYGGYGNVLAGAFDWMGSAQGSVFWAGQSIALRQYFNAWFGEDS